MVLSYNGQWSINESIEHDGKVVSPVLKHMKDENAEGVKYFDIARQEFDYCRTFYFVSVKSPWDARQLKRVEHFENVHIVRFRNSHHGIPFMKSSLPSIMNMTYEELCGLEASQHFPIVFDIGIGGLKPTLRCLWHIIRKKIFKR